MTSLNSDIIKSLNLPQSSSHKGQNGKLMVIGGSRLFHASIFWSARVAAKIVDLVHFSSPKNENNDLVRYQLKQGFWDGIVVDWADIDSYIQEDDCILIGPGMPRAEGLKAGETPTADIVNSLLEKFPEKRWVIDGGALQEVDPMLLNGNMVITPHQREWERLLSKDQKSNLITESDLVKTESDLVETESDLVKTESDLVKMQNDNSNLKIEVQTKAVVDYSTAHHNLTVLLKGPVDIVCQGDNYVLVEGGNEGLTKGGTGDVLAGLVAALYCTNDAYLSAQIGSFINKQAGDALYQSVGPFYSAGDLVNEVPKTLHSFIQTNN